MIDVLCQIKGCDGMPSYEIEDNYDGQHEIECDTCGAIITFEIEFDPVAVNEKIKEKQQ